MSKSPFLIILSILLPVPLFYSTQTFAADESALYDLAPDDSAFIRIINTNSHGSINARLNEKPLVIDGFCNASPFSYVVEGKQVLKTGTVNWSGELKANKAYTFILNNDEVVLIEDEAFNDPRKGLFSVYNLTDNNSIAIKTGDGSKNIFSDIPRQKSVSRKVNPIKIELAVYTGNSLLGKTGETIFERGRSASLFVCGNNDTYLTSWSLD